MPLQFQSIILVVPSSAQKEAFVEWLHEVEPELQPSNISFINEELENISIDTIRELKKELSYSVASTAKRCICILGSNLLTTAAQNAALKMLEEPPPQTYLVLVTESLSAILPTIQSRCVIEHLELKNIHIQQLPNFDTYVALKHSSFGELIALSDTYSSKAEAIAFVSKMINDLHLLLSKKIDSGTNNHNYIFTDQNINEDITILLKTQNLLQKNGNVKVVLAECFFSIKKTE